MGVSGGENGSPVLNRVAFKQKLEGSERGRVVAREERKGIANEENASSFRARNQMMLHLNTHTERDVYLQFATQRVKNRNVMKE